MYSSDMSSYSAVYYLPFPAMDSNGVCVNSEYFYQKLQELKESTKSKTSQTTLYIVEFYDQAKTWLNLSEQQRKCSKLSSAAKMKIARKKWTLDAEGNIVNGEKKYVAPRRQLHKILSEAHSYTCHSGRDKTEKYLQMSYNGIPQ